MEKYIKYKRIVKNIYENNKNEFDTQDFFDKLITDGWDIIYYNENEKKSNHPDLTSSLKITVVVGKKQNNIL